MHTSETPRYHQVRCCSMDKAPQPTPNRGPRLWPSRIRARLALVGYPQQNEPAATSPTHNPMPTAPVGAANTISGLDLAPVPMGATTSRRSIRIGPVPARLSHRYCGSAACWGLSPRCSGRTKSCATGGFAAEHRADRRTGGPSSAARTCRQTHGIPWVSFLSLSQALGLAQGLSYGFAAPLTRADADTFL